MFWKTTLQVFHEHYRSFWTVRNVGDSAPAARYPNLLHFLMTHKHFAAFNFEVQYFRCTIFHDLSILRKGGIGSVKAIFSYSVRFYF